MVRFPAQRRGKPKHRAGPPHIGLSKWTTSVLNQSTMGSVHIFQRFSQQENVVTNNTLLLLSRIHRENADMFTDVLGDLFEGQGPTVGPVFVQQERGKGRSSTVPDGSIAQSSFRVLVETKVTAPWLLPQLEGHLASFGTEDVRILLLLGKVPPPDALVQQLEKLALAAASADRPAVAIVPMSFERLIHIVRERLDERDRGLEELVDDFAGFAAHAGLLPTEPYMMRVVPCGTSFAENHALRLYYEAATRGSQAHRFLGIYKGKAVRLVGEVARRVCANLVDGQIQADVKLAGEESQRILDAIVAANKHGWDIRTGFRFTLVKEFFPTEFAKVSAGGMRKHRVLDLRNYAKAKPIASASEVATALNGLTWT